LIITNSNSNYLIIVEGAALAHVEEVSHFGSFGRGQAGAEGLRRSGSHHVQDSSEVHFEKKNGFSLL